MIGQWVSRWDTSGEASRPLTKWHLVESEIEDRRVVKCGRELGTIEDTELAWTENPTSDRCYYCDR